MNLRRLIRSTTWLLAIVAAVYFGVGGFYLYTESQREKTWHDEAVANAQDQSVRQWREAKGRTPIVDWFFVNEKRHTYVVRLFKDGRYVSAVYDQVIHGVGDPIQSPMPKRFETGRLAVPDWQALQSLLTKMYNDRQQFYASNHREDGNLTLAYSHRDAVPVRYGLTTQEYDQWPATYRQFDERLFAAMRSWAVKPHHGYSRASASLAYGKQELPGLVRLLKSDRSAAHAAVVTRMAALGEPARAELLAVLRAGEQTRYLPSSRYLAAMDGLALLGGPDDEGFAEIRKIAKDSSALPGRKVLQARAADIIGRREIDQHIASHWVLPRNEPTIIRTLTSSEQSALEQALADIETRIDAKRRPAEAMLVALGEPVLPALFERLANGEPNNRSYRDLLDVAAQVGGSAAIVHSIRESGVSPSMAVKPLQDIGRDGVAGLLLLMESPDNAARLSSFYALEADDYANDTPRFVAHLNRNRELSLATSSTAVRALHSDAMINTMKLLRKHVSADRTTVEALVKVAFATELDESARIVALESLGLLKPLPPAVRNQLQEMAGFESGAVYDALEAVVEAP